MGVLVLPLEYHHSSEIFLPRDCHYGNQRNRMVLQTLAARLRRGLPIACGKALEAFLGLALNVPFNPFISHGSLC